MTVGVLLLAAGEGRRFGSDKRRALLPGGLTLLAAVVKNIRRTGLPLRVCLRPGEEHLATQAGLLPAEIMACAQAHVGMGRTLAEGVSRLPSWGGVLVALADMPDIQPETFLSVAACLQPDEIVVPTWQGRAGHPVGFGEAWFVHLAQLTGDLGARDVVQRAGGQRRALTVADPGIVHDIDYPADLVGRAVTAG